MKCKGVSLLVAVIVFLFLAGCKDQKEREKDFFTACHNGDAKKIASYLKDNESEDADAAAITCLLLTAKQGHTNLMEALLQARNGLNFQSKVESTTLWVAAKDGYTNLVEALLQAEVNPNVQNNVGSTALLISIGAEHYDIADLLVRYKKTDVNLPNQWGATPLMLAGNRNQEELVLHMIERGADISAKNKEGETALKQAKERGHTEIINILQEHSEGSEYSVTSSLIKQEDDENSGKALVKRHILLEGELSKEAIENELMRMYEEALNLKGWKHQSRTTMIALFAYRTKAHHESGVGQWSAMLSWNKGMAEPSIKFRDAELEYLEKPPEEKWGLSEEQRIKICNELTFALYSLALKGEGTLNEWEVQKPIAEKYGLTEEQVKDLHIESMLKNWPDATTEELLKKLNTNLEENQ